MFIERKTHHAPWLDGASVKDRFRLDEKDVNRFTEGRYTADMIAHDLRQKDIEKATIDDVHFIAKGVQTSFREKRLQPMLRVFYNRTAFQLPGDQRMRVSLDTDLTFIREDHLDGQLRRQPPHNWRRNDVGIDYPFSYLKESDVLRFPYAILETKLQTHLGQEPPAWLTSLVESHLVHEVPRFSKYLHGACHFYRERMPLLPWWLAELNVDIRKPRAEHIGLTRSRSFKPLIDGRYRRAMIEEQERANQQAVVNQGTTAVGTLAPSQQQQKQRPRSNNSSSDDGQWRTVSTTNGPTTTTNYMAVRLNDNHSLPPPLPEKNNSNHHPPPPPSNGNFLPPKVNDFLNNQGNKWISKLRGKIGTDSESGSSTKPFGASVDDDPREYKRQRVKVRVEPKVFFANERTFISWLQFSALIMTVALSLLNFGDQTSRVIGGVFLALAAGVAIYALYRFEKRAW